MSDLRILFSNDVTRDVRTPSHELARTHMMLRARRRILAAEPGWAFIDEGRDVLLDRRSLSSDQPLKSEAATAQTGDAELDVQLAAIDALIARSSRRLANPIPPDLHAQTSPDQVADRFDAWRRALSKTAGLTAVAAAAAAAVA